MEVYAYLRDIYHLIGCGKKYLIEKTGLTERVIDNYFSSRYRKKEEPEKRIAAALLGEGNADAPLMVRIADFYKQRLHGYYGTAEEVFIKSYQHLPDREKAYLKSIANMFAWQCRHAE